VCFSGNRIPSYTCPLPQGHGTVFEDNGDTYEGDFLYGQKHGRGRAVYGGRPIDGFGGDVYEGHFENDLK